MATTLSTVARSNLGKHRLRFALTSIGIAISAFFLVAVLMSNLSLMTSVRQASASLYGNADLVLEDPTHAQLPLSSAPYLNKDIAQKAQTSPLVESTWGVAVITDILTFTGSSDKQETIMVARTDLPADSSVLSLPLQEGSLPSDSTQVLVPSSLAKDRDLRVGETVTMADYTVPASENLDGLSTAEFRISGIYEQKIAMGHMANMVFTGGTLTAGFNKAGDDNPTSGYNLLLIKLAPGVSADEFEKELATAGSEVSVSSVSSKIEQDIDSSIGGISQVTALVLSFGLLALLMSSFVIANTYRVYAASRTRELALLRTLGATRFALVRMLLLEAFMLGVLSALAGVVTAYGLAFLANIGIQGFYVIDFSPLPAIIALMICGVVTVISALAPAWSMRKISPVAAIQTTPEPEATSVLKKVWFWGVALLLAAIVATGIYWGQNEPLQPGYVLATVALATLLVLVFPFFLYPLLAVLAKFTRPFTPAGMAHSNIRQARSQTAITGRMLFICAAFLAALFTGYTTVKVSALADFEKASAFPVTGYITARSWDQKTQIETAVQSVEGVSGTTLGVPQGSLERSEGWVDVYSANLEELARIAPKSFSSPVLDRRLLLSRQMAESLALSDGSTVSVKGTQETVDLTVQLTDTELYVPLMSATTGQEISGQQLVTAEENFSRNAYLIAGFDEGVPYEQKIDTLPAIATAAGITVDELSGSVPMSRAVELVFTIAFYVALALLGATLIITLVGIANTQILSAYQRRRPYALLRVAGMSKKQLRSMISYETTQIAFVSLLLGIGAGFGCAVLLLQVYTSNGARLIYSVQGWDLLLVLVGGLLLTWLTSLIPALRASRLSPVVSLQETH